MKNSKNIFTNKKFMVQYKYKKHAKENKLKKMTKAESVGAVERERERERLFIQHKICLLGHTQR